MRAIFLSFLIFSFTNYYYPQFNPGARQISLSNSDVALSNDVFSLFNNPAGTAQINWREIGVYYSPAPFGFTELANGYAAYNEPLDFGSLMIGGMTYGFELYRENKISAGISYNYENKFFGGAVLNYHTVSIKNYGNTSAFYLNTGALVYLTNQLRLGFFIHNINRASFANIENQIPIVFNSGFSYDPTTEITLNASIEKEIDKSFSLNAGIEYNIVEYVSLRTGFSNEPDKYSAGVGINYLSVSLDYAMYTHPDLGLTHQAGLIFSFGETGLRNVRIRKYLNLP